MSFIKYLSASSLFDKPSFLYNIFSLLQLYLIYLILALI